MIPPTFVVALAVLAAAPAARPLYYDHWIERNDLRERSSEELRLMRNTIYARAGREFKDPDLRAYFSKQPWYRPTATPAKLSAIDERNLVNLKKWEPTAKAISDLRRLVPGWKTNAKVHPPLDCVAGIQWDRKQESRVFALGRRLDWSHVEGYEGDVGDAIWTSKGMTKPEVGLSCAPDLDGDGTPEAIVQVSRKYRQKEFINNGMAVVFLVSRSGPDWRGVAPLGVADTIPGIEGHRETNVDVVKLASGKLALAVETVSGGGGECDSYIEKVSVFTLKGGTLIPVASFDTSEPLCLNEP